LCRFVVGWNRFGGGRGVLLWCGQIGWDSCDTWDRCDRCLGWNRVVVVGLRGKGGVVDGGVESSGGGGDFAGVGEAREHAADVVVFESGSTGDLCAVEWGGAFF